VEEIAAYFKHDVTTVLRSEKREVAGDLRQLEDLSGVPGSVNIPLAS
jgi:hypothetical protein